MEVDKSDYQPCLLLTFSISLDFIQLLAYEFHKVTLHIILPKLSAYAITKLLHD